VERFENESDMCGFRSLNDSTSKMVLPVTTLGLQHAMEPDIGSESRFQHTTPAFDGGFLSEYCNDVWYAINQNGVAIYPTVNNC